MDESALPPSLRDDLLALLHEQTRLNFRMLTALIALNEGKRVPEDSIDRLMGGVGEIFGRQMRVLKAIQRSGDDD